MANVPSNHRDSNRMKPFGERPSRSFPFGMFGRLSHTERALTVLNLVIVLVVTMPIIALVWFSLQGGVESLVHLWRTVLPKASVTTFMLMIGIGLLTGLIGAMSAWLVSFFEFRGRTFFAWALVLPLAMPTYLASYAFVEYFSFTGPLQTLVRGVGGFSSSRDYWFPQVRSVGGAIFVFSFVLYPYVYLAVRALFHAQGSRTIESARSLGASQWRVLRQILIPMARPAIALGVSLALMETLNDVGGMEYLGVQSVTFAIFSTWLNRGDMAGATQLALMLLIVVLALILIERKARARRSYHNAHAMAERGFAHREQLGAIGQISAIIACGIPVFVGFGIPLYVFGKYALRYIDQGLPSRMIDALITSVVLASVAGVIAAALAIGLRFSVRSNGTRFTHALVRLASVGYAVPGTIIALGIFLPLANLDNLIDGAMRQWFGISTGLLITGSGATIVYAYVVRFMAMAEGSIDNGLSKVSPNLDMAARSLGKSEKTTFKTIVLPLIKPSIATAFLLVFIDSLKELSATLLLRPFGINTLSVYMYEFASSGRVEEAAIAAMIIVLIGILPVYLLARSMLKT